MGPQYPLRPIHMDVQFSVILLPNAEHHLQNTHTSLSIHHMMAKQSPSWNVAKQGWVQNVGDFCTYASFAGSPKTRIWAILGPLTTYPWLLGTPLQAAKVRNFQHPDQPRTLSPSHIPNPGALRNYMRKSVTQIDPVGSLPLSCVLLLSRFWLQFQIIANSDATGGGMQSRYKYCRRVP